MRPPIRITALTDVESSDFARRLLFLAQDDAGSPLGTASLRMFAKQGQRHLAELELHVHPAERHKGVGSELLDTAVGAAREDVRRAVITQAEAGSPGDHFFQAKGFRKVLTLTYARLALAQADVAVLTAIVEQPHAGYRLTSWDGVVPDNLAQTFADARRAMDDTPMDDTDYGTVSWDVDRVRSVAQAVAKRGDLLHSTAAIAESTGTIVAFTELVVPGDRGEGDKAQNGQHYGTGVLPEHRGHGLGRWIKAAAIHQARERYPDLGGLLADTADSNHPMRRINDALGYHPTHTSIEYQLVL